MAISKIDSKALTDSSVVDADIADGTITSAKLAGSVANAKLQNSTVTINGTAVALGASASLDSISWQAVKTAAFNAVAGEGYFVNTTSGVITVTLPASPSIGDTIAIKDYAGTYATNNLTIARNGKNIQGVANDSLISTNRASLILVFVDDTKGWVYTVESNVGEFYPTYIAATGGTVATSGDYKIHSFTGDGCFVVSSLANPVGGPNSVDYLVVAGGGGGGGGAGGGGGGAGGFRESSGIASGSYTASPLGACVSSIPVSATTYPITIGGGGAGTGPSTPGSNGSNSIFSTITSSGGGGGGYFKAVGIAGASGGGGAGRANYAGGAGNTPPVSPPQGNAGGAANAPDASGDNDSGGGGGGATAVGRVGNNSCSPQAGPGGAGATTSISASPTAYAGGGGGGRCFNDSIGTGGTGGGGNGGGSSSPIGVAGTANTGGGGGGAGNPNDGPTGSGAGGSGIVIIRYKFQ